MEIKMTFNEVATSLTVSRQTIYSYIQRGLLTPIKTFNNRVYFERKEVEGLLGPLAQRLTGGLHENSN